MKRRIYKLFVLFVLTAFTAEAQTTGYHYQAPINKINSDGFYNIILTPELNAQLKTDYSDLRIINDSGKWVPHLIRSLNSEYVYDQVIWDLKIIEKENSSKLTDLIVKSEDSITSNLVIYLSNSVAERFCSLTGSNDLNSWFAINDSILIKPANNFEKDNSFFDINFPPSAYKYFRIQVDNRNKGSFNIVRIGTRGIASLPNNIKHYTLVENPASLIFQKDSGKISFIKVEQQVKYHFMEIALKISGVKYYNRNAELYIPSSAAHSFSNPGKLTSSFTVSNNSTLRLRLPVSNAKTFYILIHNDDNLPLKVDGVKTYTNYQIATAYLEKSNHYTLLLNNADAVAAEYDLTLKDIFAKDSLPTAMIGPLATLAGTSEKNAPKDKSTKLIWFLIGLAVIILSFFTYRLVTDMNKKNNGI